MDSLALTLLRKLKQVGDWAKEGDPRAKPYLDADAVRVVDGAPQFHRERFLDVYSGELIAGAEKMPDVGY